MHKHQYIEQFESQVKDLIDGYRQVHGEAPTVIIKWEEKDLHGDTFIKGCMPVVDTPKREVVPPDDIRDVLVTLSDGKGIERLVQWFLVVYNISGFRRQGCGVYD